MLGKTDGKYAGRMVNCPKCKQAFRLEGPAGEGVPQDRPDFKPVSKLAAWDEDRKARQAAKEQARIEKQARAIEHAQTVEEERLDRSEVEVLTAIENLLLEQTQKLTGLKEGITAVWWALLWIALFTMLSCADSCHRMAGEQEMKVRVVRSLY